MRGRVAALASVVLAAVVSGCSALGSAPIDRRASPSIPSPAAMDSTSNPTPKAVTCPDPRPVAPAGADGVVRPAVAATLDLFADASVVAIGEYHGWTAEHDFFAQLVCDPRFPAVVDAVVVEFANRRLQSILDRYVAGDVMSSAELASLWRESTQRSGVFDNPVYERLLSLIRSVNERLGPSDRVQVLAGDPPIDYSTVREYGDCVSEDPACFDYWIQRRGESYAEVVMEEVLARGRTALLIAGAGHMTRRPSDDERPPDIPDRIEAAWPGETRVVVPHRDGGPTDPSLEDRVRAWPVPSLALLRDTWVGALDGCLLEDDSEGSAGAPCPDGAGATFADLADGFLYVGPS